ncbi:hypothetical protein [Paenibacillus lautus]|uniref:hypothetical protein n=1 Tax=Paenibacillus lautus TaxID=1401 RepID=UPI001C7DCB6B|nr:hypothetical protein [Paenibacillus lautus]
MQRGQYRRVVSIANIADRITASAASPLCSVASIAACAAPPPHRLCSYVHTTHRHSFASSVLRTASPDLLTDTSSLICLIRARFLNLTDTGSLITAKRYLFTIIF